MRGRPDQVDVAPPPPPQKHSKFKDPTEVIYLKKKYTKTKEKVGKVMFELNTPRAPSGPERIEDAMRRRHCRLRIWGSAGCDSFCELWRVDVRGCVGTVVDLYGFWRALAARGRFLAVFWADSAICVALLAKTTIECKKWCQELLKISQN